MSNITKDAIKSRSKKDWIENIIIDQIQKIIFDDELVKRLADMAMERQGINTMILQDVLQALKQGRNPIVLSERREHVKLLAERLKGQCTQIITLVGTASAKERRETMIHLSAIQEMNHW